MYELIQLSEHDYYIDCPSKMGIVRTGDTNNVVMIDSGNDKDAAKKALRHIEDNGWNLTTLLITHSHADHIGGNRYLQDKTGCMIIANGLESIYSNHPILEPMGLYGGFPLSELKTKFYMAQESHVNHIRDGRLPEGMQVIYLPGHAFEMTGYITPDGNAYIGDSITSAGTIEKYRITYQWDIAGALKTLEYLKTLEVKHYIPAHAPVVENIEELADMNRDGIYDVRDSILDICKEPVTFDMLYKKIFDKYGISMNIGQWALIGSTIRSYLTWLRSLDLIEYEFIDNMLYWKTK